MPDPNQKLMPPEDLPEFMQSMPLVTGAELMGLGEGDFQKRLQDLLAADSRARKRGAANPVDVLRQEAARLSP